MNNWTYSDKSLHQNTRERIHFNDPSNMMTYLPPLQTD